MVGLWVIPGIKKLTPKNKKSSILASKSYMLWTKNMANKFLPWKATAILRHYQGSIKCKETCVHRRLRDDDKTAIRE